MQRTMLAKLWPALLASLLLASPAGATTFHTDVITPNFTFDNIDETSSFGDPEPLFGQPTGIGDSLHFSPPNFTALTSGAGGFDGTGALLHVEVMANAINTPLLSLDIQEKGDYTLLGPGTASTYVYMSMSGYVEVIATISGTNLLYTFPILDTLLVSMPIAPPPTQLWSMGVFIDIASVIPDVTKVKIYLDNDLYALSEAGTVAKVQKKITSGLVITPTPEPSTLMLIGGGLLASLLGTRKRKGSLS